MAGTDQRETRRRERAEDGDDADPGKIFDDLLQFFIGPEAGDDV